jgi:hypothetical protein
MKYKAGIRIFVFLFSLNLHQLTAQQIQIDRGVRSNGLWCFPSIDDTSGYFYLPANAKLSINESSLPEFSFIRYVNSVQESKANENSSIANAGGGGVLHFLVEYETNPSQITKALEDLKRIKNNKKAIIRGPLIFKEGRYGLISSIINPETGEGEKKLYAVGNAPVLEGSKIALSFSMDAKNSKILLESFKTSTPDLSLVFDMTFAGLTDTYDAELTIDWGEVRKSMGIKGGLSVYVVSLEAEYMIDELFKKNAIRLKTTGSDAVTEALLTNVYNKLLTLLFEPAPPEQSNQQENTGLTQALSSLLGSGGGTGSRAAGFGLNAGFKMKEMKTSGTGIINFNTRTATERHHFITFNIGNFYSKYGNDENHFKTVSLDDPDFLVRQVMVGIDGDVVPEFEKMINNVTVTLKKEHDNGEETIGQLSLDKKAIQTGSQKYITYGAVGDTDRVNWLSYQYKTSFQFAGGKSYETQWKEQTDALISVYTPYERKLISVDGNAQVLINNKVRAVVIQVEYPFFNETRKIQVSVRPGDDFSTKNFEITLPLQKPEYSYKITWMMSDGKSKEMSGKDNSGIIFIDNIPN